jgi:very-short-patch-repair endonuclease
MREAQNILSSLDKDIDQHKSDSIPSTMNTEEPLEKMVQSKLQELGYIAHTRAGNSDYTLDLAVVHPDIPSKYILAVECDGESFLSAASTRERDITRQDFLENKGWKLERVWSRNWWRDSDKEIERIRQKIEKIRRKDKSEDDDAGLDRGITGLRTEDNEQSSSLDREPSIEELIKNGESNTMEFKASMRWDYAAGQRGANDMGPPTVKDVKYCRG